MDIQGSSPLARGLPRAWVRVCARVGIIPARAGFTAAAYGDGSGDRDHPRSRGVYLNHLTMFPSVPGSSPLARGLQRLSSWSLWSPRIIPARAGFTVAFRRRARVARDHPRSRGVYSHGPSRRFAQVGSSPLARGLRGDCVGHCGSFRIIPARAGFTPVNSTRAPPTSDHPRSRGVYCGWTPLPARPIGSSPLARGLHTPATQRGGRRRIIPARAGFTRRRGAGRRWSRDHPRSRGVYAAPSNRSRPYCGSSPLARGLPSAPTAASSTCRIIPARAGFTRRW